MTYCWPMPSICRITYDGQFYDQIFTPDFFGELAKLMEVSPTRENLVTLRQGHFQAFSAFTTGQFEQTNFQNLKDENTRLDRVAKDADKLLESLDALYEFGRSQTKLKSEIVINPTSYTGPNGRSLVSLLDNDRPDNPFFTIKQLVSDLWVSAQRAKIMKPKPRPNLYVGSESDSNLDAISGLVLDKDWTSIGDEAADHTRWKKLKEAHKLSSDHALVQFVKNFKTVWVALSPHAFTQGHYYDKIGHEPSRTVATMKLCFATYAPEISPQAIVTAIRKVQASG